MYYYCSRYEGVVYRASVLDVDEKASLAHLLYIDHGNVEEVSFRDIYHYPAELNIYPKQAFAITLDGIPECEESDLENMEKVFEEAKLKFELVDEITNTVTLRSKKDPFLLSTLYFHDCNLGPSSNITIDPDIPRLTLETGELVDVKITNVQQIQSMFFVVKLSHFPYIETISNRIKEFLAQKGNFENYFGYKPPKFGAAIARIQGGEFRRVFTFDTEGNRYRCQCYDTGDILMLSENNLGRYLNFLDSIPILSFSFQLNCSDETLKSVMLEEFQMEMKCKTFKFEVKKYDQELDVYIVEESTPDEPFDS